jgi:alpha-ketoglutarate-dependent taurine dioxygenase
MTAMDDARLRHRDIKPEIGAEILASKAELLSGVHAAELRSLLELKGVLVFPKVSFTDEEQIAFTKTLGVFAPEMRGEEIYKITLDKSQTSTAEYLKGTFFWHFDGFMNKQPIRASILSSKVLSPTGGNTEFANTYAAYDALPEARKQQIEGLRAIHALASTQLDVEPEPSYEKFQEWLAIGRTELPLVWKHESGRKSLVIGNSAFSVIGMDPLESKALLIYLRSFATQDRFHYSHTWSVGDAVMWDNTGTLHRATPYPADCGRMLHRTKLQGEEPLA